jgi:aconitate decarboxylase
VDHVGWKYRPKDFTTAQLNLPFCVATLLLENDVFIDQLSEDSLDDPLRMALADKVQVVPDPAITARGAKARHAVRVEVLLKDGRHLERSVEAPRGSEQDFATKEEIVAKFEKLAGRTLLPNQVSSIREAVLHLESLPDVAVLTRLLTKPEPGTTKERSV